VITALPKKNNPMMHAKVLTLQTGTPLGNIITILTEGTRGNGLVHIKLI
jgi:hypothetical protein